MGNTSGFSGSDESFKLVRLLDILAGFVYLKNLASNQSQTIEEGILMRKIKRIVISF